MDDAASKLDQRTSSHTIGAHLDAAADSLDKVIRGEENLTILRILPAPPPSLPRVKTSAFISMFHTFFLPLPLPPHELYMCINSP